MAVILHVTCTNTCTVGSCSWRDGLNRKSPSIFVDGDLDYCLRSSDDTLIVNGNSSSKIAEQNHRKEDNPLHFLPRQWIVCVLVGVVAVLIQKPCEERKSDRDGSESRFSNKEEKRQWKCKEEENLSQTQNGSSLETEKHRAIHSITIHSRVGLDCLRPLPTFGLSSNLGKRDFRKKIDKSRGRNVVDESRLRRNARLILR